MAATSGAAQEAQAGLNPLRSGLGFNPWVGLLGCWFHRVGTSYFSLNPLRSGLGFNLTENLSLKDANSFIGLNPLRSGLGFNEDVEK